MNWILYIIIVIILYNIINIYFIYYYKFYYIFLWILYLIYYLYRHPQNIRALGWQSGHTKMQMPPAILVLKFQTCNSDSGIPRLCPSAAVPKSTRRNFRPPFTPSGSPLMPLRLTPLPSNLVPPIKHQRWLRASQRVPGRRKAPQGTRIASGRRGASRGVLGDSGSLRPFGPEPSLILSHVSCFRPPDPPPPTASGSLRLRSYPQLL